MIDLIIKTNGSERRLKLPVDEQSVPGIVEKNSVTTVMVVNEPESLRYCNLLTVPLTVFAIVMLHLQILQEERYLEKAFGTAYREYKRHTFRYLGWR